MDGMYGNVTSSLSGYGTLTVSNGGVVNVGTSFYIGAGGTGSVMVNGTNSSITVATPDGTSALTIGSGLPTQDTNGNFMILENSVGSGTLTVANGGTVTANQISIAAQSGTTGTLNVGNYGENGTAGKINASTITFGSGSGTMNFNQVDRSTISSVISGNGRVNQLGLGTTILTASNTFSGPTVVSAGTLVISSYGSLSGAGLTTVSTGGTLQNNGLIAGLTTINEGGTLTGNGGSFDNLTIEGGSALLWNVNSFTNSTTGWDQLSAQSLDLADLSSTNRLTIRIAGTSGAVSGQSLYSFAFLNFSNNITGFDASNFTINSSNFIAGPNLPAGIWSLTAMSNVGGGGALTLNYTAVPEPSAYALFCIGAVVILVIYRRRAAPRPAASSVACLPPRGL
jgi:autotransporter-associated beta strand protein